MAKSKAKSDPAVLTPIENIGDLITCLQTYSPDESLDNVNHDFLRAILRKLRGILEKSSSELNNSRIHAIEQCYVDNSVAENFDCWRDNPTNFWELSLGELPKYSRLHGTNAKLRTFFDGALALEIQNKIRRIHWRFITISAHTHFRRRYPTGKITDDKVRRYLTEVGLTASNREVARCIGILTGGQRRTAFCQKLQAASQNTARQVVTGVNTDTKESDKSDHESQHHPVDYGPMFMDTIPDDIWDKKNGLYGHEAKASMAHLLSIKIRQWSTNSGCEALATKLLTFHEHLIWEESAINRSKRQGDSLVSHESKRPRWVAPHPAATGQVNENASPRQEMESAEGHVPHTLALLTAACSVMSATSRTDDLGRSGHEAVISSIPQTSVPSWWNAKQAQAATGYYDAHSRIALGQTNMEHLASVSLHGREPWESNPRAVASLSESSPLATPARATQQPIVSANTTSNGINEAAETHQGRQVLDCGQSPFSNMLNSGYLETLWPDTTPGPAADLLQSNNSNIFSSTQQSLPVLNSNDLDALWDYARQCTTKNAEADMQMCS